MIWNDDGGGKEKVRSQDTGRFRGGSRHSTRSVGRISTMGAHAVSGGA